ncbi:MAG: ATP-binding protein [Pseudomonadota bacterium]
MMTMTLKTFNSLINKEGLGLFRQDQKQAKAFKNLVALLIIAGAAGLRVWPLGALELRIPWVTFYPAVMAVALYGGFASGLFATALSALAVLFWSPTDQPFIDDPADYLGMAVFCVNGTLIALMSGAMHRAKDQANLAKNQAEAANRAKSVFLANMSHELRTPLNAILGFTNLLQKTKGVPPDQIEKLNIISNSGENLLNLINNVLDISKIEAGHMVQENVRVNLTRLLLDIQSLFSIKISEKKLHFDMAISPHLPETVVTDPGKLRQVLINLVANAIKYTSNGSIRLSASVLKQTTASQAVLRFEVQDSGIGIRLEDQQIIFKSFEQIGDQPASESGTGLGLSICKQFIELMGGHIGVESEPEKGSVFYFEIPVKILSQLEKKPVDAAHSPLSGLARQKQGHRILIAEDRLENRLLLEQILEPLGFEIRHAVNGQEAVEIFEHWHPDLIWMDIRMPVLNGLDATRTIRAAKNGKNTIIIALTAHALEQERIEILAAGCDDFIRKPYRDTQIFSVLENRLGIGFTDHEQRPARQSHGLDRHQLMQLPRDLIQDLQTAALLLDEQLSLKAAQSIGQYNHKLGESICDMVAHFNYRGILEHIKSLNQGKQ